MRRTQESTPLSWHALEKFENVQKYPSLEFPGPNGDNCQKKGNKRGCVSVQQSAPNENCLWWGGQYLKFTRGLAAKQRRHKKYIINTHLHIKMHICGFILACNSCERTKLPPRYLHKWNYNITIMLLHKIKALFCKKKLLPVHLYLPVHTSTSSLDGGHGSLEGHPSANKPVVTEKRCKSAAIGTFVYSRAMEETQTCTDQILQEIKYTEKCAKKYSQTPKIDPKYITPRWYLHSWANIKSEGALCLGGQIKLLYPAIGRNHDNFPMIYHTSHTDIPAHTPACSPATQTRAHHSAARAGTLGRSPCRAGRR